MYFSFHFCWYFIHFDIIHYEHGGRGGGLLNKENLLSTTKVISRHPVHLGENL